MSPPTGIALPTRVHDGVARQPRTAGRVLLIDDRATSLDSLRPILESQDFTTKIVRAGNVAFDRALPFESPDLIVLCPQSGLEKVGTWVGQLRATGTDAPILLVASAANLSSAMEKCQGACEYLIDSCSAEHLLATIHRMMDYRRLQVQNELYRVHLEQIISERTQALQRTMQQIERSYDVTLEALGDALDLKDSETEGHSKRVTAYALALGRAVGLREPELRVVGRGAFLHDIGKMAIPDAILRKPGKLTREEQKIMRTHSALGYQMLRKIPFLQGAAEIVLAHQECYDGSGYPRGLRGEQIPMGARIFALADTLDAMTSTRPYRAAATIATARAEIVRCAGSQFDPALVDVFLAIPDSLWQDLRDGITREGQAFSPFGFTFGDSLEAL